MRMNSLGTIMERLELTLHPTKTRIVGLWTGEEGFDFLRNAPSKNESRNVARKVYYTTQQWLTKRQKNAFGSG